MGALTRYMGRLIGEAEGTYMAGTPSQKEIERLTALKESTAQGLEKAVADPGLAEVGGVNREHLSAIADLVRSADLSNKAGLTAFLSDYKRITPA